MADFQRIARPRHKDGQKAIAQLRKAVGDDKAAALLGLRRVCLDFERQPIPVVRLAILLEFMLLRPQERVTLFDLLTGWRYDPRIAGVAGKTPQGENVIPAKTC